MKILVEEVEGPVEMFDPSEFRPEHKDVKQFRNFFDSDHQERVRRLYHTMHTHQSVQAVQLMRQKWLNFDHAEMTMMEVCSYLDNVIDESDPDINMPNSLHAFQTAERIRQVHPDKEWLILTGFIHDFGKLMALFGEEQWAVLGDTFPVGCPPSDNIVFGIESFRDNPDLEHPVYSKPLGMYVPKCGLDNVLMSWGHDEYLYQVLRNNEHRLPEKALHIIRYHSFYSWHTDGAYTELTSSEDDEILKWVRVFNQFDLYSKSEEVPDVIALMPYYQSLVDKFVPGVFKW